MYADREAANLATSAGFTGAYKAKDQDCTQDLRSIDVAWVPSETIFGRIELPVAVPVLAMRQLPDADASGNGFIPLERLQHGIAEIASDLMCLPQMFMTATGRRDIVSPVDVASGAIGARPKDVRLFLRDLRAPFRVIDLKMDIANMLKAKVSAPVVVIATCDYIYVYAGGDIPARAGSCRRRDAALCCILRCAKAAARPELHRMGYAWDNV